jgi:hypothetical protein
MHFPWNVDKKWAYTDSKNSMQCNSLLVGVCARGMVCRADMADCETDDEAPLLLLSTDLVLPSLHYLISAFTFANKLSSFSSVSWTISKQRTLVVVIGQGQGLGGSGLLRSHP